MAVGEIYFPEWKVTNQQGSVMSEVIKDITVLTGGNTGSDEPQSALSEIDDAAQLAIRSIQEERVAAGGAAEFVDDAKTKTATVEPSRLTENQQADRIKVFTKRAASQRDKGRAELERVYAGAMSVSLSIELYDLTVASSCERFLGLCDLAPYTIGRRGPSVLGSKPTSAVLKQYADLVEKYFVAGAEAKQSAETLYNVEHEKVMSEDDWVIPQYTKKTLQMVINAKFRGTGRLVVAMRAWDEAIRLATVLEWNGQIEPSKVADLREAERKALYQVFSFARRSLIGLYRGTIKVDAPKAAKDVDVSTEQQANSEVSEGSNLVPA